jgi:hypothetical protein
MFNARNDQRRSLPDIAGMQIVARIVSTRMTSCIFQLSVLLVRRTACWHLIGSVSVHNVVAETNMHILFSVHDFLNILIKWRFHIFINRNDISQERSLLACQKKEWMEGNDLIIVSTMFRGSVSYDMMSIPFTFHYLPYLIISFHQTKRHELNVL